MPCKQGLSGDGTITFNGVLHEEVNLSSIVVKGKTALLNLRSKVLNAMFLSMPNGSVRVTYLWPTLLHSHAVGKALRFLNLMYACTPDEQAGGYALVSFKPLNQGMLAALLPGYF